MTHQSPKERVLSLASKKPFIRTSDVATLLGVSRQFALTLIKALLQEKKLVKIGSTRAAVYVASNKSLPGSQRLTLRLKTDGLKEHEVLDRITNTFHVLQDANENVASIFTYAFSEMLNNAIEHSESKWVEIGVTTEGDEVHFTIDDFGIGAFRNVMKKRRLASELEAIQDILKGKTTTQPQAHSGEGIFFTSRIADLFTIESFGWLLRVDNAIPDTFIEPLSPVKRGTRVSFSIKKNTKKHLNALFRKFQTGGEERDFGKTEIKVRLYTMGTIYISRSQARRVLSGLEAFKKVILDFDRVPTIGQAFADEVFRVFRRRHPHVRVDAINTNEGVQFMIDRARSGNDIPKNRAGDSQVGA